MKSAQGTPLVLKVSSYPSTEKLSSCLIAIAKAGFQGVCGINSVKKTVRQKGGSFALGKERAQSGICGAGIFTSALKFIEDAKACIDQNHLDLELIATGGIVSPAQFDSFFERGATLALSATGMMWDPHLAYKYLSQSVELIGNCHE